MLTLTKLVNGWAFVMADVAIGMGAYGKFFSSRKAAVEAANKRGIAVHTDGQCVGAKGLNLDCLDEEHAMLFWVIFHRPTRANAELLVGDRRPGFTAIAAKLATYACNVAVASQCRKRGDIETALSYERHNERLYNELPADCRW